MRRHEMNFTEDKDAWWELEHEFASHMTTHNRRLDLTDNPVEDDYAEAFYEWFLEYCRGLEQERFVALVQRYAPELLKMVEV